MALYVVCHLKAVGGGSSEGRAGCLVIGRLLVASPACQSIIKKNVVYVASIVKRFEWSVVHSIETNHAVAT